MDFKVIKNNEEINCNVLFTFDDELNNKSYIVYTDGTKDEYGELEIYASRFVKRDEEYYLTEIEEDKEWDLVDHMLEEKYREAGV